jgi:hypothetical protein
MEQVYDYDILYNFIPENDKKNFLVWENSWTSNGNIIAMYRAPFSEKIVVSVTDYDALVKQLDRDNKLNKLI